MKRPLCSSYGMTLVEVMVAGIIGLIPATVMIVLYSMYSTQLRENNARLALQRQYETVAQVVAAHAHRAHRIRSSTPCYEPCNSNIETVHSVFFYESCRDTAFAGLIIRNDTLFELHEGDTIPFNAGSPVLVAPEHSSFILPGCGNRITLNLRLIKIDHKVFSLEPPKSVYRCRN